MMNAIHSHPCALVPDSVKVPAGTPRAPASSEETVTLNQGRKIEMTRTSDATPTIRSLADHRAVSNRGTGCTTFSVNRVHGTPGASVAAGTWVGSYTCAQGLTGLRLVIQAAADDNLIATFNFYAVPNNPSVPSGSFTMTGFVDPSGVFLNQGHWISQPSGWNMVNLAGSLPTAGGKSFSGSVIGCSSFALTKASRGH